MVPAFRVVGQFYQYGDGVRADKRAALFWYRRAARSGEDSAANNIGCILRDRGKFSQAMHWFQRAVKFGDADANLEICIRKGDLRKARLYLQKTRQSPWATAQSKGQATLLLKIMDD